VSYLELKHGRYSALVSPSGAALAALVYDGHDVVLPVPEGEVPTGYQGKILAPWPNRVRDATYRVHGRRERLAVTEPETGDALHGLVCWQEFTVIAHSVSQVRLVTRIFPQPGYPFTVRLLVSYTLNDRGLHISASVVNQGDRSTPYGIGAHPYLRCGSAEPDRCDLVLPSTCRVRLGAVEDELDVAAVLQGRGRPARLGRNRVDHAFTGMPQHWSVRLQDPRTGLWARLSASSRWMQIYTGDRLDRAGVAVEPMTCPANAFNSGVDLIWLRPSGSHVFTWKLDAGYGALAGAGTLGP
jgi:aldose 1-epimerase